MWFSGRTKASQAFGVGSIPITRFFVLLGSGVVSPSDGYTVNTMSEVL